MKGYKRINLPRDAFFRVIEELKYKGDRFLRPLPYDNRFGHRIMQTALNNKYYIIYKKEFYHSADAEFQTRKGYYESINKKFLDIAIDRYVGLILFCYESGVIYAINPKRMLQVGKTREQKGGEITVSVPLEELQRWDFHEDFYN